MSLRQRLRRRATRAGLRPAAAEGDGAGEGDDREAGDDRQVDGSDERAGIRLRQFGTEKALAFGLDPFVAAVLGMVTCIGGGVARNLLTLDIPMVLRAELYAVAALAGAGSIALGSALGLPPVPVMVFGAGLCLFLRLMSLYRGWRLLLLVSPIKRLTNFDSLPCTVALAGPVDER